MQNGSAGAENWMMAPLASSRSSARARWLAAALLGVFSSSYSTLVSHLAAERLGRDAGVDWMSVAAIPLRDWAISAEPTTAAIVTGIAFHQWADFSWALFFFGMLGRWTGQLRPWTLAAVALPWAAATSSLEWFALVPLFPFWQPIFPLQQPLWIGFVVHLSSAIVYPLFPYLRFGRALPARARRFVSIWAAGLISIAFVLGAASVLAGRDVELRWLGKDPAVDQTFIRHMSTHHRQGVELAALGAERASDRHLQALSRLMAASQSGEIRVMGNWWRRWFGPGMEVCSASETAAMPGYLTEARLDRVRHASRSEFDTLFVEAMTIHHRGAAAMADAELRDGSDIRLRTLAHAIRHAQQGEIALMNGATGIRAVQLSFRHMFGLDVAPGGPSASGK